MGDEESPKKYRGTFLRPNSAIIKGNPGGGVERPKGSSQRKRELNFLQKLMSRFEAIPCNFFTIHFFSLFQICTLER